MKDRLLPWHLPYWQQLRQYIQQRRLPQALLISGKAGLGKRRLAEQFAVALLCNQPDASGLACGQCRDCRLVVAGTHPDIIDLTRLQDKASISVDQIRKLIAQVSLKPQYEGYRIILIDPADALNINAANAFLKYLEEPTERTIVLLITALPGNLPVTITSRCQKLAMLAPDPELAVTWLQQQRSVLGGGEAQTALHLAKGAPLLALDYAANGLSEVHDQCFQSWMDLANRQTHPVMVAEQWHKWDGNPLLSWMAAWLIDLLKCCYDAPPHRLDNPHLYKKLGKLSERPINRQKLYILYDSVLESLRLQHTTINKQLMFENLLIQWAQLNNH